MYLFLPLANTFQHVGRKVVIFHVLNALLNDFSQVVSLCATRVQGEEIKPLLRLWSEAYRSSHNKNLQ